MSYKHKLKITALTERAHILIKLIVVSLGLASITYSYTPGGCQCTDYVKDNISQIRPYNLTSLSQKKGVMNMEFPTVGSMAVHDIGTYYGHVSVVRNVVIRSDGNMSITIKEKNWDNKCDSTGTTQINTRSGTASQLKIVGFFDPRYSVGSIYPKLNSITATSSSSGSQFWTTAMGSGFVSASSVAMIFGGWCDSWAKCVVPNNVMYSKSSTSLTVPLTLNTGTYHLYIYNPSSGKTTAGKKITIF